MGGGEYPIILLQKSSARKGGLRRRLENLEGKMVYTTRVIICITRVSAWVYFFEKSFRVPKIVPKVVSKNAQKVSYSSMCAVVLNLLLLGDISRRYEEYQGPLSKSSYDCKSLLDTMRLVLVNSSYL